MPGKVQKKTITFEKCASFSCHPVVRSLYLANLSRRKQYDLSQLNVNHAESVLQELPISVLQIDNGRFQFFTAFEAVAIAIQFPTLKMRLDMHKQISEEFILKKSWHSLSARFVFDSHKNFGLIDNFNLCKFVSDSDSDDQVIGDGKITESVFTNFAGESKKVLINQRKTTKKERRLVLTSENIRGK